MFSTPQIGGHAWNFEPVHDTDQGAFAMSYIGDIRL